MLETHTTLQPTTENLTNLSASELARRIAAGELSSVEVVEAHIRRIEAVNPVLNAVIVPLFEQARQDAQAADQARSQGAKLGPLHGVPVTIKECFNVKGTASTAGIKNRTAQLAPADDPMVARWREAGAIVLGKTNVPQLMLYNETDNPVYGRTNNPWNLKRASGGSSGGEAAIIAAGGSPLGLGSDIGGSLRTPALACGIHGFKPTTGRLPFPGEIGSLILSGQEGLTIEAGPMARRVADLSLGLKILAAPGLETFNWAVPPVPLHDPEKVSLQGLRVGVYTDDGFFPAAPALRRAVREAASALEAQGVVVEEFQPPDVSEVMQIFFGLISADAGKQALSVLGRSPRDYRISALIVLAVAPWLLRRTVVGALKLGRQSYLSQMWNSMGKRSVNNFWKLIEARNQYRSRFLAEMNSRQFDALICPPHALPALKHGGSFFLSTAGSYSMLYNLLGMPAGVVSTGRVRPGEESDRKAALDMVVRSASATEKNSAGLPVGVQVAARHWREDVALAVMAALEEQFKSQPDYPARPPL
jgi:fatty acid amide hydrolase